MNQVFLSAVQRPNKERGFTLIEVMIVVVVIGLLSAIALPSYQSYIRKSRRADAKNAVLDMASRQERFFSINNKYSTTAADLGYSALPLAIGDAGYYSLSVTASTGPAGFVAKATPNGIQQKDTECYTFQVDQTGAQTNLLSDGSKGASTSCW